MSTAYDTQRGSLKVYLGYAAGVGKTFQMLGDAHAAAQRAVDVVVAYFQPHARADAIAQLQSLELVPHGKIDYRGRTFECPNIENSDSKKQRDRKDENNVKHDYSCPPAVFYVKYLYSP